MVECTLSITHCLWLNLQLHTIDLVRTCRISSFCTLAWQLARFQLTRRIARSLGDSWASCLTLITTSSRSSSYSQIFSNLSSIQTDGDINKISSAYKTINIVRRGDLVRSSKYTAKRNGDRTEPCLTPKLTINMHDHASYHLTHE